MDGLEKSLENSLEFCYETHHSAAKLYVQVSDKYIMKIMHSILSIPHSEVEGAQIKLEASWEETSKGIQDMYNKEATRGIEKEILGLGNVNNDSMSFFPVPCRPVPRNKPTIHTRSTKTWNSCPTQTRINFS
jgi:hypothetical protein